MPRTTREIRFFATRAAFRAWLRKQHRRRAGVWVKFHRVDSGLESLSYFDALEEALCFGWIDGMRERVGTTSYLTHFAPRQAGSHWSRPNIERARRLIASGRMAAAGRRAFTARDESKTRVYADEVRRFRMSPAALRALRADPRAWTYYTAQPPFYQRAVTMWVMSAAKQETRARRLAILIDQCARGRRVKPFESSEKKRARR
jgi:uncharacterized protein YdeI (YjbR/CyaY-like superfamily)